MMEQNPSQINIPNEEHENFVSVLNNDGIQPSNVFYNVNDTITYSHTDDFSMTSDNIPTDPYTATYATTPIATDNNQYLTTSFAANATSQYHLPQFVHNNHMVNAKSPQIIEIPGYRII